MSKEKDKENGKVTELHCDFNSYKKTRYFHGMLMTEKDFINEQNYINEKRKMHNRLLHGWGVVCGFDIKPTCPESSKVIIKPGAALDCNGNDINVCDDVVVDLLKESDICSNVDPCKKPEKAKEETFYITIKYKEIPTDPVPVYSPGGTCEEKSCDFTRSRDGYCIGISRNNPCPPTKLPKNTLLEYLSKKRSAEKGRELDNNECLDKTFEEIRDSICNEPLSCPECCCEGSPYVVLGTVTITGEQSLSKIEQKMISINKGRRYVMTPMLAQYFQGALKYLLNVYPENPFLSICEEPNTCQEEVFEVGSGKETTDSDNSEQVSEGEKVEKKKTAKKISKK